MHDGVGKHWLNKPNKRLCNAGSMSVAHQFRDGMKFRVNILFQNTIFRYLFAIAMVASVFALRIWLIPLTGTGAPFVLFFAAVLVTSLFAGVGPAICAVLLSMPLGAYTFVMRRRLFHCSSILPVALVRR